MVMWEGVHQLARECTPFAEAWAYRMDREYPGADFWPLASRAMWKAMKTFDPERGVPFRYWLGSRMHREAGAAIRQWRKSIVRNAVEVCDPESMESHEAPNLGASPVDSEMIDRAISTLSAKGRLYVREKYLKGKTSVEIAKSERVTRQHVNHVILRSLADLRSSPRTEDDFR